jgi:capsular exopolysaccharide synthesis family protein
VVFGALIGLAMGLGLALLRETLDRTVHSPEDMVQLTGVVSLGIIPHIDFSQMRIRRDGMGSTAAIRAQSRGRSLTVGAAGNPITEAYRTLRTNITYSRPEQTLKTLVFTSPTPGDGKSTTAANLASTLAHQGHRVVLIDGDTRRGTLHQVFGIPRDPGLSNALVGITPIDECIHHIDLAEFGTLDLIPSGVLPPNPSELFGGRRMIEFIKEMEHRYDVVLFDSPPVTLVTDAAILGTMTNGVVLISRAGHTDKGALAYAAEQLRNVRAPIIGTVLNDFDFRRDIRYSSYGSPGYYYYASYGYGYGKSDNGYGKLDEPLSKEVGRLSLARLRDHLRVGRTDDSERG